jgi:HD-like signal output (HDOD) protein/GGDEF domain-containing protein
MNPVLDKILACTNLPSLPAVALHVIELTSDVNVSLKELSRTIQNDQGLAAKILKTVNSSFYGLRQRCASIDKALVMLGLSPVKSLALGFSLVDSIHDPHGSDGFDYVSYWRRGLYTAIGGRIGAETAGFEIGDEVFLGGLLQDVGMIAMHRALGEEYTQVLVASAKDHRALVKWELQLLDLQHPDVGAMLASRWRLPEELVMPVKYHERPGAAPAKCVDHVRFVGLGNLVHDVLTNEDASPALRSLYEKAKAWYRLDVGAVDRIVNAASDAAREMASLFSLDIGPYTNAGEVLAEAGTRSVAMVREAPDGSSVMSSTQEGSVLAGSDHDALTGALGPVGFDTAIREGFRLATEAEESLAIVQVVIDGYQHIAAEQGDGADIEAVMGVCGLLKREYEGHGGVVCRVAPGSFAVVLPCMGRLTATGLAESFLEDLRRLAPSWTSPATNEPLRVSTSIGIAALDPDTRAIFTEPGKLVMACAKAMRATQAAGGASVRVFQPRAAA